MIQSILVVITAVTYILARTVIVAEVYKHIHTYIRHAESENNVDERGAYPHVLIALDSNEY